MNPQIKRFAFAMLSLFAFSVPAIGSEERDKMMDAKAAPSDAPIITNRAVTKAGKFSVVGPIVGFSDRRDLYDHYPASLGVRRYFSENHAWEIARVNYEMYSLSAVASDVIANTGYVNDAHQARWSVSSGYVWSPIYGKYALGESKLVHFDITLGLSLGLRFASSTQVTIEPSLAMIHYVTPYFSLILPEIRTKVYSEKRTTGSEMISEFSCQVGVGWLF
jgi:outer membrane beta-barrel protein